MPKKLPEIIITRDSREKESHGWYWDEEEKKPGKVRITGTFETGLDAGDYSIVGLEDKVRIERKNGFGELYGNFITKTHRERFEREMDKLCLIPHKYILVETSLNQDTLGLSVPQIKNGPPAHALVRWLMQLGVEYDVSVMFVGECGKTVAGSILRSVARKYL